MVISHCRNSLLPLCAYVMIISPCAAAAAATGGPQGKSEADWLMQEGAGTAAGRSRGDTPAVVIRSGGDREREG